MNAPKQQKRPRRRIDGVLLLDKPQGISSNQALLKVRWLFQAEKAGHTGTLDPMATGLLPVCLGEATKFSGDLLDAQKGYDATLKLGVTTNTGDAEGEVLETKPVAVTLEALNAALEKFRGPIEQVPPMYSALKRDGKPLYEYARAGQTLERTARPVEIYRLDLVHFAGDVIEISVDCSKGTYIRTLAEDIGALLGCGAHLTALRRTHVGPLVLAGAITLEALEALSLEERDRLLAPVDALIQTLPATTLDEDATRRLRLGQAVACDPALPLGVRVRAYSPDGSLIGVGIIEEAGRLNPSRLLATHTVAL